MLKNNQKLISLTLSLAVTATSFVLPIFSNYNQVMAATTITNTRLSGNDRYETAAKIAQSGWSTSDYAIVVTGENFPDALCAAPLAKKLNAPILLTYTGILHDATKAELQRLKVKNVILVGGTGVVSTNVEKQIQSLNIATERIAGNNRYETSEKIAEKLGKSDQVVLATGENFPDALSVAPIAASKGIPILLTYSTYLSDEITPYLKNNKITKSYVIGGTGVVTDKVASRLNNPVRLSGGDRYDTNVQVLNYFKSDLKVSNIFLATAVDFPDALASAALASVTSSPLLLVSNDAFDSTKAYIHNNFNKMEKLTTIGGTGVISDALVKNIQTDFGKTTPQPTARKEGNTAGNINNMGLFATDNDYVYSTNIDVNYIVKMKSDGTQKQQLCNHEGLFLNVSGNYIFYIRVINNNEYKIYRMNTDGTNNICLNNTDTAYSLMYYNNYLYYVNDSDSGKIYRMNIDGSGRTAISSDTFCDNINITDQFIYYSVSGKEYDGGPIYRINIDGSNKTLISKTKCIFEICADNHIYFINRDDSNKLYSMKADGTDVKKLSDDNCSYLNLTDDILYYSNKSDGNKPYAIKIDGSGKTLVTNEACSYINMVNNDMYYIIPQDSK